MDCCRGKALNIDQLQRVLNAKDALNPEQKAIEKDLGDIRALGFFIAACNDDVKSIMRYVRDTRIDVWFYCRKKGEVWIYKLYTTAKDKPAAERRIAYLKKMHNFSILRRRLLGEYPLSLLTGYLAIGAGIVSQGILVPV